MAEPLHVNSLVRFLPTAPPLLRGHYGRVTRTEASLLDNGSWIYRLEAYPWIWTPYVRVSAQHLAAVSPAGTARHAFLLTHDGERTPGGALDDRLERAVEAFQTALENFHSFLGLSPETLVNAGGMKWIWLAKNGLEAAHACGIQNTQDTQVKELGDYWGEMVLASHRTAEEAARYVEE